MTLTATKPHPIYLAGKWVDSPDRLEVANPADPATPAGATYNATEAQYEEAVEAAVAAFEHTRGGFCVTDLGSTNGTKVNGKPVTTRVLAHGDRIELGGHVFHLLLEKREKPPRTWLIDDDE